MAQFILIVWLLTAILVVNSALSSAKSVQSGHGYGIIGGEMANITELPHQVYIKTDGKLLCGGSMISSRHILTAERCLIKPKEVYKVVAGTEQREIGGEEYAVAEIINYPNNASDIAVVKLAKVIKFSDKAKPIALAGPKYRIKDGAELIASGWGFYNQVPRSDKLRKVTISKVSDDECINTSDGINISQEFCAGGGGKKACWYDKGGPLIERIRKGNVLVGVIRYYSPCYGGDQNKPSVFTKVSQFNKWIKAVVKQDLQSNE